MTSDDNPYKAGATDAPQELAGRIREASAISADDDKIARFAQMGLRLLGVMFLVDGVAGLAGSITNGAPQSSALQQAGYPPTPDSYVLGWLAQSIAYIVVGAYCVIGGRWVLENIFLPSPRTRDIDESPP
ncbi:MAG: hypothetical protein KY475_04095 [Planctomycetes bacterium]|nr:hypothetical protein [Planctomycetota bacterium]